MRYKVNWNLHIDNNTYKEGDVIDILESDKARELLAIGVIEREKKPFAKDDSQMNIKVG